MKITKIIVLFFITVTLYFCGHYVLYGSFTRNCIYTEESLPVPEQISKGTLVVTKEVYVGTGQDPENSCLKNLGTIGREIINSESIDNVTVGKRYYTDKGLAVEPLSLGTTFRVVGMLSIKKHGISTIDSGSGPINYLILEDRNGIKHQIATSGLGINSEDLFLTYSEPGQPRAMLLSPFYFDYDGKFISAPKSYYDQQPLAKEWMAL